MVTEVKTIWEDLGEEAVAEVESLSRGYLDFISEAKTEREVIDFFVEELKRAGYRNIEDDIELKSGDRFYCINSGKSLAAGIIGKNGLDNGIYMLASHVDSPRIDLKPRPVYQDEETNTTLLKTQYYGGLKKYQWVNLPLSIHGRIFTRDGKEIRLSLGDREDEPIFLIPDLLPHIAKMQRDRKLFEGIEAEEMNVIFGNIPEKSGDNRFKDRIMKLLKESYGIEEEDLASSDISLVPAGRAREAGLDRSMIVGYGHDDRSSAYSTFRALIDTKSPDDTVLAMFFDREEIGSQGLTGSKSNFLEYIVMLIMRKMAKRSDPSDMLTLLRKSRVISADVSAAMDPSFKDAHDTHNAARLGSGIVISKYSGHGGKYSGSEANAEYVAYIRNILQKHDVPYQFGTLGKVDEGGGGTVAQDFARYGMNVIDAGAPVLGMHAPFELLSKVDLWSCYRAYRAFLLH